MNWAAEFVLGLAMTEKVLCSYLFQRNTVAIQRFNSLVLHDSLTVDPRIQTIRFAGDETESRFGKIRDGRVCG